MRDFFVRSSSDGDDTPVDLAQVHRDDALIEALRTAALFPDAEAPPRRLRSVDGAAGEMLFAAEDVDAADDFEAFLGMADDPSALRDPATAAADAQVRALLRAWRQEIDAVPLPPPVDTRIAAAIVAAAPRRRRSVRPMIAVAAAIAGLLMGSTAIGARSASPDDTLLWPVTQLLWGDRVEEVQASIDARKGIDKASEAIDAGHPDQAEAALDHVTVIITKVGDSSVRATLESDLGKVQSQLESSRATPSAPATTGPTTPAPSSSTTASSVPAPPPTTAPAGPAVPPAADPTLSAGTSGVVEPPPVTSADAPSTSDPVESTDGSPTEDTTDGSTTPTTSTDETTVTESSDVDDLPEPSGIRPDEEPAGGGTSAAEVSAN